jgi:hypothetical protein
MTYLFKLARRTACQRALPLIALTASLAACDSDRLTNSSEDPAPVATATPFAAPSMAAGWRGGIPFGTWATPTEQFGPVYNGAMRVIWPEGLRAELAAIKSRGGRVILSLAGKETNYLDSKGHFSLAMWKERVNRYKGVDFSSFLEDGTIIGHYIIDEPNDPVNWGGTPVPGSMVETMAAYSKQLWPKMATVARVEPRYLGETGGPYRYLDAAWAQYVSWKGTPDDYIRRNVADAQELGLALVTGLNITNGSPTRGNMSASLVQSAGSTLLAQSYPCAFISWTWIDDYMFRSDIKAAMANLSEKAENHAGRSCGGASPTEPPPTEEPAPLPGISGIVLSATKATVNGDLVVTLRWAGAAGTKVDFYRNSVYRRTIDNDGKAKAYPRQGTVTYRICEEGKTRCSNTVSVAVN